MADMACAFTVTNAEAGQKLLQCLSRRLHTPESLLHRWIRTGQVRVNGGRRKPFDRLEEGDEIRLPPFAASSLPPASSAAALPPSAEETLPIIFSSPELIVVNKPAGLPVHPGTGHADCLTARLAALFPPEECPFAPTPIHRLDRDTSGILLVARTYACLQRLSAAFARREGLRKEYLAWCAGRWPHRETLLIQDRLQKAGAPHKERMRCGQEGRHAELEATPVLCQKDASLLRLVLHTGRTHQIRVQLASRGFPVIGDAKYGGKAAFPGGAPQEGLLLHAWRLTIEGQAFSAPPPWKGRWQASAPLD